MSRAPLVDSITAVTLGVGEFAPHLQFFGAHLGFAVTRRGRFAAADARRLWGVDTPLDTVTLTAAGSETGQLHLVRVAGREPAAHPHTGDIGLVAVNVYTSDIDRAHATLTAAGHPWIAGPQSWQVPLGEAPVDVREGICLGPDATNVVIVQPRSARDTSAWRRDPSRSFTEITSVSANLPDLDAEIAFWDGLGMRCVYDVRFCSPGLERMTGLEPGTQLRLAYLTGPTGTSSRIELLATLRRGTAVDRRPAQRPGRDLGQVGWTVRTHDLPAALRRADRLGGRLRCAPFDVDSPLHGPALVASIDTPNAVAVDLVQPAHSGGTGP